MRSSRSSAAVIGAGTMGTGIAYVFAAAGYAVELVEPDPERGRAALREIVAQASRGQARGKLTAEQARELPGRIRRLQTPEGLPSSLDLIVESVPERPELKREVLRAAEARRPRLLVTNTSSLSIDALAAGLSRPRAFLGMHFFNPVWSLALVELIRGSATAPEAIDDARAHAAAIGKEAIVAADVPGFATSRLDMIAALEAIRMVGDGVASPADIDRAAELAYRHPVGPLRLSDIVGLDVRLEIARSLQREHGERFAPPALLVEMVRAGRLGRKSGEGFYAWP